jgi:hypothetical protein
MDPKSMPLDTFQRLILALKAHACKRERGAISSKKEDKAESLAGSVTRTSLNIMRKFFELKLTVNGSRSSERDRVRLSRLLLMTSANRSM